MSKTEIIATAAVVVVIIFAGCRHTTPVNAEDYPAGLRAYEHVATLHFAFSDDVGYGENGISALVFAKLRSSEIVAPVMLLPNARMGLFGPYSENVWMATCDNCTKDVTTLHLPIDDGIEQYIVLLRHAKADDELRGWKYVLEIDARAIDLPQTPVQVPALSSLPRFQDRSDAKELLKKFDAARPLVGKLNAG